MRTLSKNLQKATFSSSHHRPARGHLLGQDGHPLPSAPPPMSDWTYRVAALAAALLLLATAGGAL